MLTFDKKKSPRLKLEPSYFAILLVAMMGAAVTTLQPLIIGAYTDSNLLTDQQVSWVAICDVAGILITSVSAYFWVRRSNWYVLIISTLLIFIIANFASGYLSSFWGLAILRFIAGAACGVGYSISLAALGDMKNPDKAFGHMVTAQVIFGTLGFAILPFVIEKFGYYGVYLFFNFFLIIALLVSLKGLPTNAKLEDTFQVNLSEIWKPTMAIFLAVVVYYFAQGAVWAYLERIGVQAGLSTSAIGFYLSIGFSISAVGSVASGWFVARYGRSAATIITIIIQVICMSALFFMAPDNAWIIYALATIIYQIMWSFIIPVMMATFSDADATGRLIVFCVSAFKIGLIMGTPVAGYMVSNGDLMNVIWLGVIAILLAGVFLLWAVQLVKK